MFIQGTDDLDQYNAYAGLRGWPLFGGGSGSQPTDKARVAFDLSRGIAPPDAKLLGLHAALTKVTQDSGLRNQLAPHNNLSGSELFRLLYA